MCYRPQRGEPRSRQEADEVFGNRASEESRIFKATFTVLLFFFNLMHWGMFISFSQVKTFVILVHEMFDHLILNVFEFSSGFFFTLGIGYQGELKKTQSFAVIFFLKKSLQYLCLG